MSRILSLSLLTGALSLVSLSPALALETPGVWQNDRLEGQNAHIWPDMKGEEIMAAMEKIPYRIGSRGLTQLTKALLLAPIKLDGSEPEAAKDDADADKETPKNESQLLSEKITALRLKILLAMGGLNEAKTLVNELDEDSILEPALMEEVLLTLIADNTKQAACIDLLAYKSDAPEKFAALSDGARAVAADCTAPKAADAQKKNYTFAEIGALSDWDAAIRINSDIFSLNAMGDPIREFNALTPFQQALILRSPATSPRLQWRLIGQGLRHDYISVKQAQEIYARAELAKEKPNAQEARDTARGKAPTERLAIYLKTIKNNKADAQSLTKELAVPIVAAGASYDIYSLLPFAPYMESLDYHALRQRSGFIAGLVQSLNGTSLAAQTGNITPKDSVWVLNVLNADQPFTTEGYTQWSEANLSMLEAIAPQLEKRILLTLQEMNMDDKNKSTYLIDYVNKKTLTEGANYVMHEELALSEAESFGEKDAIGPMVVALAKSGSTASPDLMDPEGTVKVVQMLNDSGLTHTARKLAAEQLVFRLNASPTSTGE